MVFDKILTIRSNRFESHSKSLLKSIRWRIIGTLDTIAISWYLTGALSIALSIGSIEFFSNFILYYAHERIWNIN